jgi:hypothetical protein
LMLQSHGTVSTAIWSSLYASLQVYKWLDILGVLQLDVVLFHT